MFMSILQANSVIYLNTMKFSTVPIIQAGINLEERDKVSPPPLSLSLSLVLNLIKNGLIKKRRDKPAHIYTVHGTILLIIYYLSIWRTVW